MAQRFTERKEGEKEPACRLLHILSFSNFSVQLCETPVSLW